MDCGLAKSMLIYIISAANLRLLERERERECVYFIGTHNISLSCINVEMKSDKMPKNWGKNPIAFLFQYSIFVVTIFFGSQ